MRGQEGGEGEPPGAAAGLGVGTAEGRRASGREWCSSRRGGTATESTRGDVRHRPGPPPPERARHRLPRRPQATNERTSERPSDRRAARPFRRPPLSGPRLRRGEGPGAPPRPRREPEGVGAAAAAEATSRFGLYRRRRRASCSPGTPPACRSARARVTRAPAPSRREPAAAAAGPLYRPPASAAADSPRDPLLRSGELVWAAPLLPAPAPARNRGAPSARVLCECTTRGAGSSARVRVSAAEDPRSADDERVGLVNPAEGDGPRRGEGCASTAEPMGEGGERLPDDVVG